VWISRIASITVAMGYVVAAVIINGRLSRDLLILPMVLVFPLGLIWFPNEIGSYIGPLGRGPYVDTPTPGILIAIMGWFFLVGLPVILYFLARSG